MRRRVLLFGGVVSVSSTARNDLWEWDGTHWVERPTASAPPPRYDAALAFDSVRGRAVLVGGTAADVSLLADTWSWDGSAWRLEAPLTPQPPSRRSPALTWDAARQRVVLFGGRGANGDLNDLWEWDGAAWAERSSPLRPRGRAAHGLAYDAKRQRLVLFGGYTGGSIGGQSISDTWEWDGAAWQQFNPPTAPGRRMDPSMQWDPASQRVVLHGGIVPGGRSFDTWAWDGTAWTELAQNSGPGEGSLAFDHVAQRLLVAARSFPSGELMAWQWSGNAWSAQMSRGPTLGYDLTAAADPHLERVLVLASAPGQGSITAAWDGMAWHDLKPVTPPPATGAARMVYDEARQRMMLYDGNDTWRYLP